MGETCMHDRDVQCFRDCPGCCRNKPGEPDWDFLIDLSRDERSEKNGR